MWREAQSLASWAPPTLRRLGCKMRSGSELRGRGRKIRTAIYGGKSECLELRSSKANIKLILVAVRSRPSRTTASRDGRPRLGTIHSAPVHWPMPSSTMLIRIIVRTFERESLYTFCRYTFSICQPKKMSRNVQKASPTSSPYSADSPDWSTSH